MDSILSFQTKLHTTLHEQYDDKLNVELQRLHQEISDKQTQESENLMAEIEQKKTIEIDNLMQQMEQYETEISILKEKLSERAEDSETEKEDSQSEAQQEIKQLQVTLAEREQDIVNMKQDFSEVRENDLAALRQEMERDKEDALETLRIQYSQTVDEMERLKNELQQSLEDESVDGADQDSVRSLGASLHSQGTLTYQDSEDGEMEKADSEQEKDSVNELDSLRQEIARLTEELESCVPRSDLDNLRVELVNQHQESLEEMKQIWLEEKDEHILKVQSEYEANLAKKLEEFGAEMEEEKEVETQAIL